MFTLEESELLGRMLRFLGWLIFCLVVVSACYFAARQRAQRRADQAVEIHQIQP